MEYADGSGELETRTNRVNNRVETFTYEAFGRLDTYTVGSHVRTYDYDSLGNLVVGDRGAIAYDGIRGAGPHAPTSTSGVDFTYDAFGRRTRSEGGAVSWEAEYNAFDLPRRFRDPVSHAELVAFEYDGSGQRVARHEGGTTTISFDEIFEHISRSDGTLTSVYHVMVGNAEVARVERDDVSGTTSTAFIGYDPSGAVGVLVDANGVELARHFATPYGTRVDAAGAALPAAAPAGLLNPTFSTHRYDALGHVDMGARIYDPASGTFLSPDPIARDLTSARSLNAYAYVEGRPTRFFDPSGMSPCDILLPTCSAPGGSAGGGSADSYGGGSGGFLGQAAAPLAITAPGVRIETHAHGYSVNGVFHPTSVGSYAAPTATSNVRANTRGASSSPAATRSQAGRQSAGRATRGRASPQVEWDLQVANALERSAFFQGVQGFGDAASFGLTTYLAESNGSQIDRHGTAFQVGEGAGHVSAFIAMGGVQLVRGVVGLGRALPGVVRSSGRSLGAAFQTIAARFGSWIRGLRGTGAGARAIPYVSPTVAELRALGSVPGFQVHHILPEYLGKMLGYSSHQMLEHPGAFISQWSHTGAANPAAIHKAIARYLPPMVNGRKATYTADQIRLGLSRAYGDLGMPEMFDAVRHLIR